MAQQKQSIPRDNETISACETARDSLARAFPQQGISRWIIQPGSDTGKAMVTAKAGTKTVVLLTERSTNAIHKAFHELASAVNTLRVADNDEKARQERARLRAIEQQQKEAKEARAANLAKAREALAELDDSPADPLLQAMAARRLSALADDQATAVLVNFEKAHKVLTEETETETETDPETAEDIVG